MLAEDDRMSDGVSTIDPSHSASQVACRGPTVSRFFARPLEAQYEAEAEKSSASHGAQETTSVHPASLLQEPCINPEDTVEDRMFQPAWDLPVVPSDALLRGAEQLLSSPPLHSGTFAFSSRSIPSVCPYSLSQPPSPVLSQGRWAREIGRAHV